MPAVQSHPLPHCIVWLAHEAGVSLDAPFAPSRERELAPVLNVAQRSRESQYLLAVFYWCVVERLETDFAGLILIKKEQKLKRWKDICAFGSLLNYFTPKACNTAIGPVKEYSRSDFIHHPFIMSNFYSQCGGGFHGQGGGHGRGHHRSRSDPAGADIWRGASENPGYDVHQGHTQPLFPDQRQDQSSYSYNYHQQPRQGGGGGIRMAGSNVSMETAHSEMSEDRPFTAPPPPQRGSYEQLQPPQLYHGGPPPQHQPRRYMQPPPPPRSPQLQQQQQRHYPFPQTGGGQRYGDPNAGLAVSPRKLFGGTTGGAAQQPRERVTDEVMDDMTDRLRRTDLAGNTPPRQGRPPRPRPSTSSPARQKRKPNAQDVSATGVIVDQGGFDLASDPVMDLNHATVLATLLEVCGNKDPINFMTKEAFADDMTALTTENVDLSRIKDTLESFNMLHPQYHGKLHEICHQVKSRRGVASTIVKDLLRLLEIFKLEATEKGLAPLMEEDKAARLRADVIGQMLLCPGQHSSANKAFQLAGEYLRKGIHSDDKRTLCEELPPNVARYLGEHGLTVTTAPFPHVEVKSSGDDQTCVSAFSQDTFQSGQPKISDDRSAAAKGKAAREEAEVVNKNLESLKTVQEETPGDDNPSDNSSFACQSSDSVHQVPLPPAPGSKTEAPSGDWIKNAPASGASIDENKSAE